MPPQAPSSERKICGKCEMGARMKPIRMLLQAKISISSYVFYIDIVNVRCLFRCLFLFSLLTFSKPFRLDDSLVSSPPNIKKNCPKKMVGSIGIGISVWSIAIFSSFRSYKKKSFKNDERLCVVFSLFVSQWIILQSLKCKWNFQ